MTPSLPDAPAVEYVYWACDLKTGNKLEPLPLTPGGKLPNHIGLLSTASFKADLSEMRPDDDTPPIDFWGVTIPGRSFIACEAQYDGDASSDIVWAGIVLQRSGGSSPEAGLACATPEAFLSRRFILTHTYTALPTETDAHIIADLLTDAGVEGINLTIDVQGSTVRNLRYKAKEYRTVLAALQAISDLEGGSEWLIKPTWRTTERLSIGFTFYARPRLGTAGTPPNARFDFPGCITGYETTEDFLEGNGANAITPRADGGSAIGAIARDEQGLASGYPRWEQVIDKSGVKTAVELDGLGRSTLTLNARGHTTHAMTIDAARGPRYLRDIALGDDATFVVYGAESPDVAPPSYRHPDGLLETTRLMGLELDPLSDTYDPIFWTPYDGSQR